MKYATIPAASNAGRTSLKQIEDAGGWWVRFGDTHLVYSAEARWSGLASATGRSDLAAQGDVKKGDMHLVVQKGRAFQQAHPDIPVILDKGRYLVVEVPKSRAKTLVHDDETCFAIEPLRENEVVFDRAAPVAKAMRAGVADMVSALDQVRFEADLAQLTSYVTRLSGSSGFDQAANWCQGQLGAMGYGTAQTSVPLPSGQTTSNVVATKPGTANTPELVIVVAHLDSVNHPGGPAAPAPGADDNASGSAGVLALARAMSGLSFEHDVIFALFGGEEQGLHGSRNFVAGMTQADRDRTRAVLNMDMIGHVNTPGHTVLLEGAPLSQSLIDGLATAAATFTGMVVQTSLNPYASDHVPFIDAGIPAVLTIEGADGANDAIHTGNDTLDRVDPAYAMQILRMNAAFLAEQAAINTAPQPQPGGQPGDCGCGCSGCGPSASLRQLSMHYQMLLAQYARLAGVGALPETDLHHMQMLRAEHDLLVHGTAHH